MTYEDGAFYRFRKNAEIDSLIVNFNPSKFTLNLSLGNDFIHNFGNLQMGHYMSFGRIFNIPGNKEFFLITLGWHITYKNTTFFSQFTFTEISTGNMLWFGITRQFGGGQ